MAQHIDVTQPVQVQPVQIQMKAMTGTQLFGTAAGAGAVGGALGAVAAAFVTGMFSFLPNITNVDPKVTEAAIAVLQAEPEPTAAPLRQWAMTVIDKRATFSFTDEQRKALLTTKLPKPPAPPAQARPGG
jgi:hypothetical protein